MAVTIASIGAADSAMTGHTRVDYDSNGNLWTMLHSGTNNRWEFWYSTDDGATWAENTSLRIAEATGDKAAFTINPDDDFAVFVDDNDIKTILGITTTSSAWVASGVSAVGDTYDVVAFSKPSSSNNYVAWVDDAGVNTVELTTAGTFPVSTSAFALTWARSLDFNHTGDGFTVAGSTPHLYVVGDSSGDILFKKYTFASGVWTSGTERTINSSSSYDVARVAFDGSRCLIVAEEVTGNAAFYAERDAADTTTTVRALPSLAGGAEDSIVVGHYSNGDAVVAVIDASDDIEYVVYDRSGGSFGSWALLEADASLQAGSLAMVKYSTNSLLPVLWQTAAGAYKTENIGANSAPNAPTWLTPSNSSAQDAGSTLAVTWQFNDDDAGDTQSAYAIKRVISAVTTYYNAGAGTWDGTEVKNTSSTSGVTLPATWGADGDAVALSVKTWDAADTEGVYGSALNLTGSTPYTPTITAPATSATLTGPIATITWTATESSAYRYRWLTSADAVLFDSGKVSSSLKSITSAYSLANGLADIKLELRVWNDDDLVGPTDTNTLIDVTFVEPVTPTLVVTADATSGYISVAITNPAGGGGEPAVTSNEVWVRVASGGRPDGERTVNDDGIRIATGVAEDATYLDYAAGSGIDYEYRVKGLAANGAFAWSAWT